MLSLVDEDGSRKGDSNKIHNPKVKRNEDVYCFCFNEWNAQSTEREGKNKGEYVGVFSCFKR